MKKKVVATLLVAAMAVSTLAGCGSKTSDTEATVDAIGEEGKIINVYSWNDEFRQRVEAVYSEVEKTSEDGTITY